jgi:hypothetical protein
VSLPWIKVYGNLPDHPKSDALAAVLGEPRAWTHVLELWLWCSRLRPDGNLADLPPALIAKRAGWSGAAQAFVDGLRSVGFLNEDGRLHDFAQEQAAHADKLQKDRDRKAKKRGERQKGASAELPRNSVGMAADIPTISSARGEERRGEEITPIAPHPGAADAPASGVCVPPPASDAGEPLPTSEPEPATPDHGELRTEAPAGRKRRSRASDAPVTPTGPAAVVWGAYVARCDAAAVCTPGRVELIEDRLAANAPEVLVDALDRAARSEFWRGKNKTGGSLLVIERLLESQGRVDELRRLPGPKAPAAPKVAPTVAVVNPGPTATGRAEAARVLAELRNRPEPERPARSVPRPPDTPLPAAGDLEARRALLRAQAAQLESNPQPAAGAP